MNGRTMHFKHSTPRATFGLLMTLLCVYGVKAADLSQIQPATAPISLVPATNTLRPYTAFAWTSPSRSAKHVQPLIWMKPADSAALTARRLLDVGPGLRALFLFHAPDLVWGNAADFEPGIRLQSPWLTNGATFGARWADRMFDELKHEGADVDFFVTDNEVGLSMWTAPQKQITAIAADPRFAPVAKQFKLTDVSQAKNFFDWDVGWRWNAAETSLINSYFRQAFYEPLHRHFPQAGMSDWGNVLLSPACAAWSPDYNGWMSPSVLPLCGNTQAPAFYGEVHQLQNKGRNDGTNPDFKATPMPALCWSVTQMRAYLESSAYPMVPWVETRHFDCPWGKTPYYDEVIRHIMLLSGQTNLFYFNPEAAPQREPDDLALDGIIADLSTALSGCSRFTPITLTKVPFNSDTLVTGVRLPDGRRVFRVTLAPGKKTARVLLAGDTVATEAEPLPGEVGVWIMKPALP